MLKVHALNRQRITYWRLSFGISCQQTNECLSLLLFIIEIKKENENVKNNNLECKLIVCCVIFARSCLLGLVCWAIIAGPCLLGHICLVMFASSCLLGQVCWDWFARSDFLGHVCWAAFSWSCLLGHVC